MESFAVASAASGRVMKLGRENMEKILETTAREKLATKVAPRPWKGNVRPRMLRKWESVRRTEDVIRWLEVAGVAPESGLSSGSSRSGRKTWPEVSTMVR